MRSLRLAAIFAAMNVFASSATALVGTCPGGTPGTIQAAVNAASPGDTIDVCPGTFSELVTVNKALTLRGAQFGVDARTGRVGASETILNGALAAGFRTTSFNITASNVQIDGFTIQDTTSASQFASGVLISAGVSGTQIRNNIIKNNIVGLQLSNNSAVSAAVVQQNLFQTNNQPGPVTGTAIYSDQFIAGGTLQNVLIDNNKFTGQTDSSIFLSSTSAAQPATNVTISNNISDGDGRFVTAFNLTSSSVTGNTIQSSTFAGSAALRLFEGVNALTITGNTLNSGSGRALRVSNIGTGAPSATGVVFNSNSVTGFTGPAAVFQIDAGGYTGTLNAECNWWGSATGPTHITNPGGTGQSVSDFVDFVSWLDAPPPGGACVGTPIILVGSCGTPGTIQAAVNAASPGDIINVCPGTFSELVTVNKALTLRGAQFGVDARTGRVGASETILNGADLAGPRSTSFYITASNVQIDGFTIQDTTSTTQFGAGVIIGAGVSGTQIRNNIIKNNIIGLVLANNSAVSGAVIERNLFQANNQPGPATGNAIYTDQFFAGGTVQNVLIDNNRFTAQTDSSLFFSSTSVAAPATNITISNNVSDADGRFLVSLNLTSSSITGNTIQNSTFAGSSALRIFEGTSNVTFTSNTLQNGVGRAFRVSNIGTGAPSATGVIFNASSVTGFAGPTAVFQVDPGGYTGTLNAECNWWGTATGPTHASNPAGTGQSVSDFVDFTPWLIATPPAGSCFGGASMVITQGTPQSTTVATAFATALQVRVTADGSNLSGVPVTFTPNPGGNGASGAFGGPTTVLTDVNGLATAPTLTANTIAGPFTVTASATGGASATFNLTNLPGPPATMTITQGNAQSTQVLTAFATALKVRVDDSFANPVAASVTFAPVAGLSGANGSFSGPATVATDGAGVATAPTLTANSTAGPFTVTATSGALNATFNLTNDPGPPATMTITQGDPQSTQVNTAFSALLKVRIDDALGNDVPGVSVTFTPVAGGSGASGTFAGPTTVTTDSLGIATAPAFTANSTAGLFTVAATAGALNATFNLTNVAGPPASIAITQGNTQVVQTSQAFPTPLQVTLTDSSGNPTPGISVTFTPVAGGSGASASFAGSSTVMTDAAGVATAPTLTANATAGSFTVTATAGALSTTFDLSIFSTALSVLKTDGGDVYVTEPITFNIQITNSGTGNAQNVSLSDPLNAPFASLTAPGGWACATPAVGSTGTITCSIATFPPGTANFVVTLTAPATPSVVNNTATVTATTESAPLTASQSVNVVAVPTISIADASGPEGNSGTSNMTFTLTLSSAGVRPVSVQFATADGTASAPSDYTTTSGPVTFAVGVIAQTITVPIVGDMSFEADKTFVVNLSSPVGGVISDGQATGTIVNDDGQISNLAITKSGPPTTFAGIPILYSIDVTNAGPDSATAVVVTDVLPAGTSFVSATPSQGTCSGTTTVTCNLGVLTSGGSATITLIVNAVTGTVTNIASVASAASDPILANNTAQAVTTVAPAGSIPTTNEWMLAAIALALIAVGVWKTS